MSSERKIFSESPEDVLKLIYGKDDMADFVLLTIKTSIATEYAGYAHVSDVDSLDETDILSLYLPIRISEIVDETGNTGFIPAFHHSQKITLDLDEAIEISSYPGKGLKSIYMESVKNLAESYFAKSADGSNSPTQANAGDFDVPIEEGKIIHMFGTPQKPQ